MQQYFFFCFYYNILYWFYANGEKVCKGCKIGFKAKIAIMKRNTNYKNVNKKICEF